MTNKFVAIYGSGGHSQVVREILTACGKEVVATFDDHPEQRHVASKDLRPGMRLIGDHQFEPIEHPILIAVGNNAERSELAKTLPAEFVTAIHPTAIVSPTASVGDGTVIHHAAVIQAHAKIGSHVIINTSASVDHDNVIGDYAHVSPQAALSGHVEVGEGTHIGAGASVIPSIKIGKWCTIGAGAVVINDIPDYSTAVGNPARIIKRNPPAGNAVKLERDNFDLAFVGSGVATSFTLLSMVENRAELKQPLNIAIIDKSSEFHTGIPYGGRSGITALLISSLEDFLPSAETDPFYAWLSANKTWVFEEYRSAGGALSQAWLLENAEAIRTDAWGPMYLPRSIFGRYMKERVKWALESARADGYLTYELITDEVVSIDQTETGQELKLKVSPAPISAGRTVLAIGGATIVKRLEGDADGLINDPYEPSLRQTLSRIRRCLNQQDRRTNVLIVGANASAMEMIYNLRDSPDIDASIAKYLVISSRGELPHRMQVGSHSTVPMQLTHLDSLADCQALTAREILAQATSDCVDLQERGVPISESLEPVSTAVVALVGRLSPEEKLVWANECGNELGRLQRRAGPEYSSAVAALQSENRLELIRASFLGTDMSDEGLVEVKIQRGDDAEPQILDEHVSVVVNCAGGSQIAGPGSPVLLPTLVDNGIVSLTPGEGGIQVSDEFEAGRDIFVIGPFLAGNLINGQPVWHVEHTGRIASFAGQLAKSLNERLLRDSAKTKVS